MSKNLIVYDHTIQDQKEILLRIKLLRETEQASAMAPAAMNEKLLEAAHNDVQNSSFEERISQTGDESLNFRRASIWKQVPLCAVFRKTVSPIASDRAAPPDWAHVKKPVTIGMSLGVTRN
ncbi:hypothetical protein BPOR_0002g00400 [Botrytis porri]|uniref:Uncharacterized protein n=1 Tax=Botrytis porri TaxID=87229 RepID=A0A4Z1L791_9HELO|nr:hypothetical protein BPOR_0002g00400 [Botrytis porri]